MIPFACRRCKYRGQVKDDLAGKKAKCPKCGSVVQLPAVRPRQPSNPFDFDAPAEPAVRPRQPSNPFDFDAPAEEEEQKSVQEQAIAAGFDPPEPGQVDFLLHDGFTSHCARCGLPKDEADGCERREVFLRRRFSLLGSFFLGFFPVSAVVHAIYQATGIGGLIPAIFANMLAAMGWAAAFSAWNSGMPAKPVKFVFCRPCRRRAWLNVVGAAIVIPCISWIFVLCVSALDKSYKWRWVTRIRILDKRRGLLRLQFRYIYDP